MNAEIVAVGTEILIGDICNTHAQYLSRELAALGINVLRHTTVGDNPDRLHDAAKSAFLRSDLVIFTGGLGPTEDDLTKEIVCKTLQTPLVKDDDIAAKIERYFKKANKEMPKSNYKQAMVPKDAEIFKNANGTAPGCAVRAKDKIAVLLPGPPSELMPMYEKSVRPFLEKIADKIILSHNIHFYGIGESKVDEILGELLHFDNPTIGVYAKEGEVRARLTAQGASKEECENMLQPFIRQIQNRLGDSIYGIDIDSMQQAVVDAALRRHVKIAVAESCTGGMIASRIASVSGASGCFECGIVSYSNDMKHSVLGVDAGVLKEYGAVSLQTAKQMAQKVRKLAKADIGISTTGIAGPLGGTSQKPVGLVYVGISKKSGTDVHKLMLAKNANEQRESIRNQASLYALYAALRAVQNKDEKANE